MIKEYPQAVPWSQPPQEDGAVTISLRYVATAQRHMHGSIYLTMADGREFSIIEDYDRFVRDWQSVKW